MFLAEAESGGAGDSSDGEHYFNSGSRGTDPYFLDATFGSFQRDPCGHRRSPITVKHKKSLN